jgi:ankyrin repeat protein
MIVRTKMKSPSLVKWFLAHDADPNRPSKFGHTPLDIAVQQDGTDNSTRFVFVDMLLSAGAVLNQSETIHNAVCHIRSDTECIEMMEFLLAKGVDINALSFVNQTNRQPGWEESTALHWAVHRHQRRRMKKNMLVRVKWLLEHGADVRVKDSKGKTPLDEATDDALIELLSSGSSS